MAQSLQETAVLGGGCFWCVEAVFKRVKGVMETYPGYAGGTTEKPTYKQVCTGETGHAEVVKIVFDPEEISYETLLNIFFAVHDPTTLNRQGNDVGTQYRSVIFYRNEQQKQIAEKVIKEITQKRIYEKPIVTEIVPLRKFYPAEAYHKDYYDKNPEQGYCQFVISPKVNKFRKRFSEYLKEK